MSQSTFPYEPWLAAMIAVARHYRLDYSEENVRVSLEWEQGAALDIVLDRMARQLGLVVRFEPFDPVQLDPWRMPMIVEFTDGQVGVLEKMDSEGHISVLFSGDKGMSTPLNATEISERIKLVILLKPESSVPDARVDEYIKPYKKDWFWAIALRDWRRYIDIMLASLVANVLALAGMVFSMQVYDRVVPAQSEATLWVLFGGVMLAIFFEFIMRMTRVHISDIIGKRADLKISDKVFGHALRIRNSARSKSTGSFISQIRELEQVRELITSTTISTLSDLPFFLLFVAILWAIGGPLVFVVLVALPMLLIPGLLIQRPLAKLSNEGMRESAIRNAMLVEAVESLDDIKLLRAEQRFQNQWNHINDVSATISMKQRFLTSLLMTWTQEVQGIVYAVVLLVGCYMVMSGDMTTGALVGMTILSSRTIAPLSQISGVMSRWQQAKVARTGIDELMKRPIDQPEHSKAVHRAVIRGSYQIRNAIFKYSEDDQLPALAIQKLDIRAGEKIALLGRNGAGKSTLLQLLSGMQIAESGQLLLDGINMPLLDPADVRRDMGMLTQNARLFFGTVRENLTMGMPLATDEDIVRALTLSGALPFVQSQQNGINFQIMEGGLGLSGGQRQALLLARTLIRQPNILLLDEPTAWLDEVTEKQIIERMSGWLKHRTLVVATHRLSILALVDRIIVVDGGKIVMDGPKQQILDRHFKS